LVGLDARQEAALLALLRVAADGELVAEQMRCRLCESYDFDPYELFKCLQGTWCSQKGWINTHDLHRWLTGQPHGLAKVSVDDVAGLMALYEMQPGEIRYEGFLRIVLPKDPANSWLKDAAMMRSSQGAYRPGTMDGRVLPEVAYRLCLLFENEVDICRHLKFHRNYLLDLGIDRLVILRFFDSDPGASSLSGLISQMGMRRILVEKLGALTFAQCEALLRRINPSGSSLTTVDELYKVLLLGLVGQSHVMLSPRRSVIEPFSLYGDARTATPLAWKEHRELAASPLKVVPRTWSPLRGVDWQAGSRSADVGVDFSRDWSPSRFGFAFADSGTAYKVALAEDSNSCYTPLRDSPRSASRGGYKIPDVTCPGLGSTRASTNDFCLTSPPLYAPGSRAASAWPRFEDRPASWAALETRVRGTTQLGAMSPISPRALRRSWSPSSPMREPVSPRLEARSVLRASSPISPRALRSNFEGHLSPRALRANFEGVVPGISESRDWRSQIVQRVMGVMMCQAELDSQAEDAKSLLAASTTLESIFATLDRFHKGYITDTDLCQYSQDFGGLGGFGLFSTLMHEVLLRRPRDASAFPGRLNLRELVMLVLPVATQEQEAALAASSDAELRSILYLLRHSEPCPRCSIRVQRDADSAGCPSVTCPVCGTVFRCFVVVGDIYNGVSAESAPLPVATQYQLFRLLDTAARVADELEQGRKRLQLVLNGEGGLGVLSSAFSYIADGRPAFLMGDLRRALFSQDILVSEHQLGLLWRRYAPHGGIEVSFSEFLRQLKPRESQP